MAASKRRYRRFTAQEYDDYLKMPQWQRDNEEWGDEDEYHAHWAQTIRSWRQMYRDAYGPRVEQWQQAVEYIEAMPEKSDFDIVMPEAGIARQRVEYALAGIMRQISTLYSNYPQPQFISPTMSFDKYASALNQQAQIEMKANSFNALMFDLGLDIAYAGFGVLKPYVDPDEPGPFGQDGKITIHKIDPGKVYVDPKAKRLKWSCMRYVIVEDEIDLGEARQRYKGGAHRIEESMRGKREPNNRDGMYGRHLVSIVPAVGEDTLHDRDHVSVMECWFKDDRYKFVADDVSRDNPMTLTDDNGMPVPNPDYNPDKPEVYTEPDVDDEGYVIGKWVPAYPNGRCIVLCGSDTVVQDFENPYWHNQAPFIFYRGAPSRKLFPMGDLVRIVQLDRKINDLLSRIHGMAQEEIERPMMTDNRAFRPPRAMHKATGSKNTIVVVQQGSTFMRLPFQEIPQFTWQLLSIYMKALDDAIAMAGVMRGDLTEGSQLSAEAVSSLQGMAAGMLKMKAELIAEGNKDFGYQLLWLQRETYDEGIQIPVAQPDGQTIVVEWHEKEAASDYLVDIQSGTGLPGAEAAQSNEAMGLWREALIDRPKALQMMKMNDWAQICERMDKAQKELIATDAAGRAQGLYLKNILNPEKKDGSAGRKQK